MCEVLQHAFSLDRCHRIGQTRPVVIFRLVTKNTVDESIVQRAQAKRAIEKLVVHQDKFKSGMSSLKETTEKVLSPRQIMDILLNQDDIDATEEASDDQYGLAEKLLDELMDRSDIVKVSPAFFQLEFRGLNKISCCSSTFRCNFSFSISLHAHFFLLPSSSFSRKSLVNPNNSYSSNCWN